MKVLFLDESGDHNLSVIDPHYPMFVLGGVIMDADYARGPLSDALNDFKKQRLGRTDIVLHTADIVRNRNGFERMQELGFRTEFLKGLNTLMRWADYRAVACTVHKTAHLARYGFGAVDPCMLSLDVLVERFCLDVGNVAHGGIIFAEKRDPVLDRERDLAWLNLKISGTRFLQAQAIDRRMDGLRLRAKSENIAGLRRPPARGCALEVRRAAAGQCQLWLAPAHPPPPRPERDGGRGACQRLHVVGPVGRGRHSPRHGGEVLFIDARKLGHMVDRTSKAFSDDDIAKIAGTYHAWRGEPDANAYEDEPGFCKAATLEEIKAHNHVLTPGRFVGAAAAETDDVPFEERFTALKETLAEQFAEADELAATIRARLAGIGV